MVSNVLDDTIDKLQKLLAIKPNINIYLENPKNKLAFDILNIKEEDIPDIETLTDLKLIQSSLSGDLTAKKYIDERMGRLNKKTDKRIIEKYKLLINS